MYEVVIPLSSFIGSWHSGSPECNTLGWLVKYIGSVGSGKWNVNMLPADSNEAVFWFENEEDAIAFKLRWS